MHQSLLCAIEPRETHKCCLAVFTEVEYYSTIFVPPIFFFFVFSFGCRYGILKFHLHNYACPYVRVPTALSAYANSRAPKLRITAVLLANEFSKRTRVPTYWVVRAHDELRFSFNRVSAMLFDLQMNVVLRCLTLGLWKMLRIVLTFPDFGKLI